MTILHVSDFHFTKRWFNWLQDGAPPHDLLVISGDLLSLSDPASHRRQIGWITDWIQHHPRPICLCSGNHDLEWDTRAERWTPAYWLRSLSSPSVWIDGQRVTLDGLSLLNISCTTQPKGGLADIWVVHAPPTGTLVSTRTSGREAGDPDLVEPVRRYSPKVLLSGHVHDPVRWCDRKGPTLFLNPGQTPGAPFPNHILLNTADLSCQFISQTRRETQHGPRVVRTRTAAESPVEAAASA